MLGFKKLNINGRRRRGGVVASVAATISNLVITDGASFEVQFDTDTASGTAYVVIDTDALTFADEADLITKAAAADFSDSFAISTSPDVTSDLGDTGLANGTYNIYVVQVVSGELSNVLSDTLVVDVAAYAQNVLRMTADDEFLYGKDDFLNSGVTLSPRGAMSVWMGNSQVSQFGDLFTMSGIGVNMNGNTQARISIRDSAETQVYRATITGIDISTAGLDNLVVIVDLSVPSANIYWNGTLLTTSGSPAITVNTALTAGTGLLTPKGTGLNSTVDMGINLQNRYALDFADLISDYGTARTVADFYNGGTPPNPEFLTPSTLWGGSMKADEDNGGDTAKGINDGYTIRTWAGGTATVAGTFTDVV